MSKFVLEYITTGGPELGAGLQQYDTRLVIDGATGIARLDTARPGGDAEGLPIGRFEATMDAGELADLQRRAWSMSAAAQPSVRGGPGSSTIVLRCSGDAGGWAHELNSNDPGGLAPFDALLEPLNLVIGRLYATPSAALGLEVVAGAPLVVRLRNLGRVELAVLDPTVLGAADDDAWAGVRIAPFPAEQPGITSAPLEWQKIALAPSGATGPRRTLVLGVGQHLDFPTLPWTPRSAGRHLVQAIIADYAGADVLDGRPHVRGAMFSASLEHTP